MSKFFMCIGFWRDNAVQVCSALSASEIRDLQSPHFYFLLKVSMLRLHVRPSALFFPAADCCETTAPVPRIAIAIAKAAYQNLDTDKSVFPKTPVTASVFYQERAVPPCQYFFLTYSYKVQNAPVIISDRPKLWSVDPFYRCFIILSLRLSKALSRIFLFPIKKHVCMPYQNKHYGAYLMCSRYSVLCVCWGSIFVQHYRR